jgi:single-stranded DNA-binding protein
MGIEAAFFGILTRDAESKVSAAGKPFLRIVGLRIGTGDGAQWISANVFDKDAIATAEKFVKSAAVYIEGRITLDKWKSQAGEDRSGLSCMSWYCRLSQIGRHKSKRTRHTQGEQTDARPLTLEGQAPADLDDEIPF